MNVRDARDVHDAHVYGCDSVPLNLFHPTSGGRRTYFLRSKLDCVG